MKEDLTDYRKSYEKGTLSEENLSPDPIVQFGHWFREVEGKGGVEEANAMTVATVGADGFPKSRVVLLKKFDDKGFYFYTNYNSDKGQAIAHNNKVALSFFWPNLERQIIIQGIAEKTSEKDSTDYFLSRPKGSQIGALVSDQSRVITSREVLDSKQEELETKYQHTEITKPEWWGGYVIRPVAIEFWQGRASRLHDRIRYTREGDLWRIERLSP